MMLLGCVWAPSEKVDTFNKKIKEFKKIYSTRIELKWTKVSPKNINFYLSLVDWFFAEPDLHFRTLVVPDKSILDHKKFKHGSHDNFYYKLYFWLLNKIVSPENVYEIFLDVKDTQSRAKVRDLREKLCFDQFDFSGDMITQLRSIRSHESQLLQLADFLIGAVAYKHRGLTTSPTKLAVIERIETHLQRDLLSRTSLYEDKFNIFIWQPKPRVR